MSRRLGDRDCRRTAVHLLNDAWLDRYDCAVVVSNDSDLAEAMRLIREHHPSKLLGLVFPRHHGHPSAQLVKHAAFVKKLGPQIVPIGAGT